MKRIRLFESIGKLRQRLRHSANMFAMGPPVPRQMRFEDGEGCMMQDEGMIKVLMDQEAEKIA